ncbi:MAG: hypothetical protein ACQEQ5_06085 [Thermodesulfobacteriota bacterium]
MCIRNQVCVWAGILAVLLMPGAGAAASKTAEIQVLTFGVQPIAQEDTSKARQAAVSAALEQAVARAFSQVVSPQVFASNLAFLYTRILPAAQDYIVTFKVLGESTHQNQYLVGVESRVHSGMLEQTLAEAGILKTETEQPKVLLLIAEQTAQDLLPKYWWGNNPEPYHSHAEIRMAEMLAQKRFQLTGLGPERPDPRMYDIRFPSIYDPDAAVDLAKKVDADLVVLGRAGATESSNRMGDEKIFDATVYMDVLDVTSGESVAGCEHQASAKAETGGRPGDVLAIVQAADLAAADLAAQIDRAWTQKQRKERAFDVRIEGNEFLPRFIALKKRFAEIREIENVQPREIGSDQAVLEMVYKGTPDDFAQRIMLTAFDGFGIEIIEVSDTLVSIRFVDDSTILE